MFGMFKKVLPTLAAERRKMGHDGLMHLLEARRGRGKSSTMMTWARSAALERRPIRANFAINGYRLALQLYQAKVFESLSDAADWTAENVRYISHWDDILDFYDGVVFLDEASRLFDSRNRKDVPPIAFEWLQQSRKLKLTLVFASQSFDWLDVRTRQLFDILWTVRKEVSRKNKALPTRFWLYGFDPFSNGLSDNVDRGQSDFLMTVPFDLEVSTLYNSWELIQLVSGEPSWANVGQLRAYLTEKGVIVDTPPKYSVDSQLMCTVLPRHYYSKLLGRAGVQRPGANVGPVEQRRRVYLVDEDIPASIAFERRWRVPWWRLSG
jgi:hypothetical protein